MKKNWIAYALALWLLLLAGIALNIVGAGDRPEPLPVTSAATAMDASDRLANPAAPMSPASLVEVVEQTRNVEEGLAQFVAVPPASLMDVPPPVPVGVTSDGRLIVDIRLRNVFEHYLTALGEESLSQILIRIRHALAEQLAGEALAQASAILESFIQYRNLQDVIRQDYRQSLAGMEFDAATIKAMTQDMRQARSQLFTQAQEAALFSQEDANQDYAVARLDIIGNDAAAPAERSQALAELNQHYAFDSVSAAERDLQRKLATDASLRAESSSTNDTYAQRSSVFGSAAADRLAERDRARLEWQRRLASYRVELEVLLAIDPIDPSMVRELRAYHFTEVEQLRVAALDRIAYGTLLGEI